MKTKHVLVTNEAKTTVIIHIVDLINWCVEFWTDIHRVLRAEGFYFLLVPDINRSSIGVSKI
jgi:hypothetical protein